MYRLLISCLLAATCALGLAGCSGDSGPDLTPAQVAHRLQTAKKRLDSSGSVRLTLSTDHLPKGVSGVKHAAGVATHAPAFRGTITLAATGLFDGQDVDVVSVGGQVYAQTPFSTSFIRVDPADFDAPDPAALMSTDTGLSTLLTSATHLSAEDQQRVGKDVVSTFAGSVPGASVARIFPSASSARPFHATFVVDNENRVRGVTVTGPFYRDRPPVTYHVGLFSSEEPVAISAP